MEDKIVMPRCLTAENGAKALLIGEFFEEIEVICPECFSDEAILPDEECEVCQGEGKINQKVPVSWTTIKEIYKKAVKHLGQEIIE
ncbi:MAG: hypothetical protein V1838_04190 [Patescibacteria group bacterium]